MISPQSRQSLVRTPISQLSLNPSYLATAVRMYDTSISLYSTNSIAFHLLLIANMLQWGNRLVQEDLTILKIFILIKPSPLVGNPILDGLDLSTRELPICDSGWVGGKSKPAKIERVVWRKKRRVGVKIGSPTLLHVHIVGNRSIPDVNV